MSGSESNTDPPRQELVDRYIQARQQLQAQFRSTLAAEVDQDHRQILPNTVARVGQRMRELFGGRVPGKYRVCSAYSGVQPVMFGYLVRRRGDCVPGTHLRVLTGDQVHTERCVRELRDVGFRRTPAAWTSWRTDRATPLSRSVSSCWCARGSVSASR